MISTKGMIFLSTQLPKFLHLLLSDVQRFLDDSPLCVGKVRSELTA